MNRERLCPRRFRNRSWTVFWLRPACELDCSRHRSHLGRDSGRALGCDSRRGNSGAVQERHSHVRGKVSGVRSGDKDTNQITEPMSELFRGKNFGYLSTLMKDGSPQVTEIWVDFEDGNIIVNTAEGRLKHKNISRDPRIAICVVDQNNPYHMVIV